MSGTLLQIVLVVWRESVEALIVVAVLAGWLARQAPAARRRGRLFLGAGIVAGLLFSLAIAGVILFVGEWLDGDRQDYFQAAMVLTAAALVLQMVVWMRGHAQGMRDALESGAERALAAANGLGLFVLVALAIAREGSETAIFLYGILAAAGGSVDLAALAAAFLGLAAALACYAALRFGARALSWKAFFRLSEALLLVLAGSLVMAGLDRLIALDLLPPLTPPLWNTAWLLDDGRGLGGLVAALTGYRARPELLPVLVFAGYWITVAILLGRGPAPRKATVS